jgi:hypothetical protein
LAAKLLIEKSTGGNAENRAHNRLGFARKRRSVLESSPSLPTKNIQRWESIPPTRKKPS